MINLPVEYIEIEDLEKDKQYYCLARNFTIGLWDGDKFLYIRKKFNSEFEDTAFHYDTGPPHGTVKPLAKLTRPLNTRLNREYDLAEIYERTKVANFKASSRLEGIEL